MARVKNHLQVAVAAGILALAGNAPGATPPTRVIQFNRDIRPILVGKCFECHGPAASTTETKLRLDTLERATRAHEGRRAIVPGKPGESELIRRVTSTNAEQVMPPRAHAKGLSAREVGMMSQWIEQGAKWEGHWAFIPPVATPDPVVANTNWARNFIDLYLLAKMETEGVKPSPEADRRTLLRRMSFDLTGLPPRPVDVDEFVGDPDSVAYEKHLARLLDPEVTPQYGERMAMHWLDLVRYGDSDGYHADNPRLVWPYRDYVVWAFNSNQAFDQFTIAQLAGDLLPDAGQGTRIASGYNRLVKTTEEGGANEKDYLTRYAADRVRTTASVWLGLTLGCAECHDHKSDPLTQRDFYSFAASFADLKEKGVGAQEPERFGTPEQMRKLAVVQKEYDNLAARVNELSKAALDGRDPWVNALRTNDQAGRLAWVPVSYLNFASLVGRKFQVRPDQSVLITGPELADSAMIEFSSPLDTVDLIRIEILRDPEVARALERAGIPYEYHLSEFTVQRLRQGEPPESLPMRYVLAEANADKSYGAYAIDGDPATSWGINADFKTDNVRLGFHFQETATGGQGVRWRIRLLNQSGVPHANIRHLRVSVGREGAWVPSDDGLPAPVRRAFAKAPEYWLDEDRAALTNHYLASHPVIWPAGEERRAAQMRLEALLLQIPSSLISDSGEPRVTRILRRGDWTDQSGETVAPAVPAIFQAGSAGTNRLTRLELARWLVARDNPLTARVFVNRLWRLFFGTGLVRTADDFGVHGDPPSHPELLDRLAVEFMESGWNVKHVVALIVTSSAYRQASIDRADLEAHVPQNPLFARQGRWRLEAEMIRDNALRVSGILVTNLGGTPVFPYQPAGHLDHLDFPRRGYAPSDSFNQYRRGLYAFWQRSFLNPSLAVFDAPSREECVAARPISNTPSQALALLNSPTQVEAAVVLAAHIVGQTGMSPADRVTWVVRQVLHRPPTAGEAAALAEPHERQLARHRARPDKAFPLEEFIQYRPGAGAPLDEFSACLAVARAVLNLHETITRQ